MANDGNIFWTPTAEESAILEVEGIVPSNIDSQLLENQYLLIKYDDDPVIHNIYVKHNGSLEKIMRGSFKIKSSDEARKTSITITPRNPLQHCAFDLLSNRNVTLKLILGKWGTGKTLFLVSAALDALANKKSGFSKIVWVRNNVDVKDTKDIGALPGDVWEKLKPFLGPFIDHCGEEKTKSLVEHGQLLVEPLQFIRGRSWNNAIIMCSECENLTKEHLQLIIARAGEGSEVWLDGDVKQRDKAIFEKSKGVETLISKLSGNKLFGYVVLTQSERSETAALADLLD